MDTAVTQKGQVTIPKAVRDGMGLRPGSRVKIELDGEGSARIVIAEHRPTGFARFRGVGRDPDGLGTDEYMRLIRDEIDT